VFNSQRVFGKHFFLESQLLTGITTTDIDWVPTLQLAKKNYRAKLGYDASAERDERTKK